MRPRRILMRDTTAPHQIHLFMVGHEIAVSCNCMRNIDGTAAHWSPLEVRDRWETAEALEVYWRHLDEPPVTVPIGIGRGRLARVRELAP